MEPVIAQGKQEKHVDAEQGLFFPGGKEGFPVLRHPEQPQDKGCEHCRKKRILGGAKRHQTIHRMEAQKQKASKLKPAGRPSLAQKQADVRVKQRHRSHLNERIQKSSRLVPGLSAAGQRVSQHPRHAQKGRVQDRMMACHLAVHKGHQLPAAVVGKDPRPGRQKHRDPGQKENTCAEQIKLPIRELRKPEAAFLFLHAPARQRP